MITIFVHLGIYVKLAGKAFPRDSLPTGALAVFGVDASDWTLLERNNCRLMDFLRPKALRANHNLNP